MKATATRMLYVQLALAILAMAFSVVTVVTVYVAIWANSAQWGATAFASGIIAFLLGTSVALVAS